MYFKIGFFISIVFFIALSIPLAEMFLRWAKIKLDNFINETETKGEIETRIKFFYELIKHKYNKQFKYLKIDTLGYIPTILVGMTLCVVIPLIWPLMVFGGTGYAILLMLRKIKRLEKLIK